ncbi:MAG: hypothetical protein DIU68_007955 [Chloroflexota bacterium]
MAAAGYLLEHFYYGQSVELGAPQKALKLLALSPGLQPGDLPDIVRAAPMPPMPSVPLGAWGVVRVRPTHFVFVQSQLNRAGAAVMHYVILPADLLRGLGGNLRAIMHLLQTEMPVFDGKVARLEPVSIPEVGPPGVTAQVDAMLALMSCTRQRLDVIEQLLAAIVEGVPLIIHNAPPNPAQRTALVEGLLALLPPSARFGVTFAMHALRGTRLDAHIRFLSGQDVSAPGTLVYDWADGRVIGEHLSNDYSRFIMSQFRLDPELVLEQTELLTPVAAWRIKQGDSLAKALAYASHRLVLDNSLQNNLPVEADDVARVLAEDPTLSAELRVDYARHVMAFAIGLGDIRQADLLTTIVPQEPLVEAAVLSQLQDAAQAGKARVIFDLVLHWLRMPDGPRGMEWIGLAQSTAQKCVEELVAAGDSLALRQFLLEAHHADPVAEISHTMPALLSRALPLSVGDEELARTIFVLAINYLAAEQLQRLFSQSQFVMLLPEPLVVFGDYLSGARSEPKARIIVDAAAAFDEDWSALVLIRLVELALLGRRYELLETSALEAMARVSQLPHADLYDNVFRWLVGALSVDSVLRTLEPAGAYALLRILLARRAFPDLAQEMLRHARILYGAVELQKTYAALVRRLFFETPLPHDDTISALRYLDAGGVKPLPLAMAHFGALAQARWTERLHESAINLTTLLASYPAVASVVPPACLMELLEYHTRRRDLVESMRVATLLPQVAASAGDQGTALIVKAFRLHDWDRPAQAAALDLLRRYIRAVDDERAEEAVNALVRALGENLAAPLMATCALRQMMGGEDLASYALLLNVTVEFLHDTAVVYVDKREAPGLKSLLGDLDSLAGGLTDDDRDALARGMLQLGRAIEALGRRQKETRPRNLKSHVQALYEGKAQPKQALDVLRVLGGSLSDGRPQPVEIKQAPTSHPFRDRAAPSVLLEVRVAVRVLSNLARAFPPHRIAALTPPVLRAEIESLLADLPIAERNRVGAEIAADLLRLPELVWHIYNSGDTKALEESSSLGRKLDSNRQRPESTLEFYRFVRGYFMQRIRER